MKKALKILLGIVVVAALFMKFVFFGARAVPDKARFAIDLAALREQAGPVEACPATAHALKVASFEQPAAGVIAGEGLSMLPFGFYVWQLAWADGSSAILDPVHSKRTNEKQASGTPYDEAAWKDQEAAIAKAST